MGAGYSMKAKGNASAEIYIYEDVGEGWFGGVSAKQFATDLKGLGAVSTIDVRINSYGGEVFDGLAMYRQLVEHPAHIVTHIDGVAASIASVIAMAGNEIRISQAGFIMIHDAWAVAIGNASEMRQMADVLDNTSGAITDVYTARTKADRGDIRKWMQAESWFTGAEAVEHGFADHIDENLKVAAHGCASKHRFRNMPQGLVARSSPAAEFPAVPRPHFDAANEMLDRMRGRLNSRLTQSQAA